VGPYGRFANRDEPVFNRHERLAGWNEPTFHCRGRLASRNEPAVRLRESLAGRHEPSVPVKSSLVLVGEPPVRVHGPLVPVGEPSVAGIKPVPTRHPLAAPLRRPPSKVPGCSRKVSRRPLKVRRRARKHGGRSARAGGALPVGRNLSVSAFVLSGDKGGSMAWTRPTLGIAVATTLFACAPHPAPVLETPPAYEQRDQSVTDEDLNSSPGGECLSCRQRSPLRARGHT
jgi:hypothetical protein